MAENEAKARKKLEEAEKKARGGGGFLGSLFGGSKADEAADLFVQVGLFSLNFFCSFCERNSKCVKAVLTSSFCVNL